MENVYTEDELRISLANLKNLLEKRARNNPRQFMLEMSSYLPAPHNQLEEHFRRWDDVIAAASELHSKLPSNSNLLPLISDALEYPKINVTFIIPKIELRGPTSRFPPPHAFLIGQAHFTWQKIFEAIKDPLLRSNAGKIGEEFFANMQLCALTNPIPMEHLFFRTYSLMLFAGNPSSGQVIRVLENIGRLSMTTLVSSGNALGLENVPFFEWSVYGRHDRKNLPDILKAYSRYTAFPVGLIEANGEWWRQPDQLHHWAGEPRSRILFIGNVGSWLK